ncbi:SRPBCC family protein [Epibacterium sp. Ofav1-8]|uniref:SRPBCC family protein n=1 Tax=Epibacterium sp. Ofav1-8 TaxID=2917735 RepID=UPI001EF64682|nr:SRPBCC family protein [Epibacterium sp. Ofav1-8]MCG7623988.1 SRPBCC family protein [Epibacterium sp. Ofav1-8]
MHFETKEDIDCSIEQAFAAITDFEAFERSAIRRGAEVQRIGEVVAPAPGLAWEVAFVFRGSQRQMTVSLQEHDRPNAIAVLAKGNGMSGTMRVELLALSPRRTRMTVRVDLTPKTLAARLLIQSLKLARNKLNRKFRQRVAEFAKATEERLAQSA